VGRRRWQAAAQAAGHIASYAIEVTEAPGLTLDHRLCEADTGELDVPHLAELVRACFELGSRPSWSLAGLLLGRWPHILGLGGHFATTARR
jgi:hypothetical protein